MDLFRFRQEIFDWLHIFFQMGKVAYVYVGLEHVWVCCRSSQMAELKPSV